MELLVVNLSGKVRRAKLHGRDFYVAPLSMLVPGVLNGSEGPLYYPLDEIERNPADWNYMPIIAPDHPVANGKPVSARNPEILDTHGIGHVFNSVVNGKLDAEGWFDVERTRLIEPQVLMALEAGHPLELSTGLGTVHDRIAGVHNGKNYIGTARNYRPDHLAVLIGKEGACSRRDGCGVLVNEQNSQGVLAKVLSALGLEGLVKLTNIVSTVPPETVAAQQRQTVANKETDMSKLDTTARKTIVDNLVANCDCSGAKVWNEEDRKYLDGLPDERLTALDESRKRVANTEKLLANSHKTFEHGESVFVFNTSKGVYEATPKQAAKFTDSTGKVFVFNQTTGSYAPEQSASATQPTAVATKTDAEWLTSAPPGIRSVVLNAMQQEAKERADLVTRIMTNNKTGLTKEALATFPLDNDPSKGITGLRTLTTMLAFNSEADSDPMTRLFNSYLGQNAPAITANTEEAVGDLLPLPSMSFEPRQRQTAKQTA